MNTMKTLCVAVALTLAAGTAAFGQGYGNDRRSDSGDNRRNDRGDMRHGNRGDIRHDNRGDNRGRGHAYGHQRQDMRSFGEFRRGQRLPPEYRNRQYVVNDWRGHHLSAPPRGYHWVQHGSDYVLVAITTGIIANLILNHQY